MAPRIPLALRKDKIKEFLSKTQKEIHHVPLWNSSKARKEHKISIILERFIRNINIWRRAIITILTAVKQGQTYTTDTSTYPLTRLNNILHTLPEINQALTNIQTLNEDWKQAEILANDSKIKRFNKTKRIQQLICEGIENIIHFTWYIITKEEIPQWFYNNTTTNDNTQNNNYKPESINSQHFSETWKAVREAYNLYTDNRATAYKINHPRYQPTPKHFNHIGKEILEAYFKKLEEKRKQLLKQSYININGNNENTSTNSNINKDKERMMQYIQHLEEQARAKSNNEQNATNTL